MSDDSIIHVTLEELQKHIQEVLDATPSSTVGELRDSLDHDLCHFDCCDHHAEYYPQWRDLSGTLFLAGIEWSTCD